MILTRVQAYILDLLSKLKYMKTSQLYWFLHNCYGMNSGQTDRQLHQLCYLNKLRLETEYIFLPWSKRDDDLIAAVDIMLLFCSEAMPSFCVGTVPYKLVFFTPTEDNKVNIFKMIFVEVGQEIPLAIEAENLNERHDHTILFCLRDKAQISLMKDAREAYFVLADESGGYKFYK